MENGHFLGLGRGGVQTQHQTCLSPPSSILTRLLALGPFSREVLGPPERSPTPRPGGHLLHTFWPPREETPGGAGQAHTSGRAQLPIGPGQAVETRGRDANGGADLLPQDCGPGVHLRHVSQVPGTEANSARTTEVFRWRDCPPAPPGPVGRWCRRVQLRPPGTPVASRPRAARPTGGSASQEAAPRGPVLCSSGPTSPPPHLPRGAWVSQQPCPDSQPSAALINSQNKA